MSSRIDTVNKISDLLDNNCKGCKTKTEFYRGKGSNSTFITEHCSVVCPIGIELGKLGQALNNDTQSNRTKQEDKPMTKFKMTEEQFNAERASGKSVAQIAKEQGVTEVTVYNHISKWADSRKPGKEKLLREKNVSPPGPPSEELLLKAEKEIERLTTEVTELLERQERLKADITVLTENNDQSAALCREHEEETRRLDQRMMAAHSEATKAWAEVERLRDKMDESDRQWREQIENRTEKNMELVRERNDLLHEINRLTDQIADLEEQLSQQEPVNAVPDTEVHRLESAIQDLTRARWILKRLSASGE